MLDIWQVLGIAPTRDKEVIQKAYNRIISQIRLEDSIADYKIVYLAYQEAMELATESEREVNSSVAAENTHDLEPDFANESLGEEGVEFTRLFDKAVDASTSSENRQDLEPDFSSESSREDVNDQPEYDQELFAKIKSDLEETEYDLVNPFLQKELESHQAKASSDLTEFSMEEINDKTFWDQRFARVSTDYSEVYEEILHSIQRIEDKGVLRFLYLTSFAKVQDSQKQVQVRNSIVTQFSTLYPKLESKSFFDVSAWDKILKALLGSLFFIGLCLVTLGENGIWLPLVFLFLTDAMSLVRDLKLINRYLQDEWERYYRLEKWNRLYVILVIIISFIQIGGYFFTPPTFVFVLFLPILVSRLLLLKGNISYKLSIDYNVEYVYWFPIILLPLLVLFSLISPFFFLYDLSSTRLVINEVAAGFLIFSAYVLLNHYGLPLASWKTNPVFTFVKIAGQLLFRLQFFYFLLLLFTKVGWHEMVLGTLLAIFSLQIILGLVNTIQIRKLKKKIDFPKGHFINSIYLSFLRRGGNK